MKKVALFIVGSLLYVGCSSKATSEISVKNKNQVVHIGKSGDLLFYAYLKDGETLTRISKKQLDAKEDEEIVRVYSEGYYPIFNLNSGLEAIDMCGYGLTGTFKDGNKFFCTSNYSKVEAPVTNTMLNILISPVLLLNASLGNSATYVQKEFFQSLFKNAIKGTNLESIKDEVLKHPNILDGGAMTVTEINKFLEY
jgi:hypothetical protein